MVAFLATTMFASAQIYVGGGLNFNRVDVDGEKSTTYGIAPEVGYVVNDNWAFGAVLGYDDLDEEGKKFSIKPYARYTYFRAGAFSLFADGAFAYDITKPEEGDDLKSWSLGVEPGLAYNINENFSVVAKFGHFGYQDEDETSTISLDLDNELSFSIYYNF